MTYEAWRGEPRGKYRKGDSFEGRGDCIDCRQCVAVCPMGIDIRDGFQLECIGCGLCIDACDHVMERIGRPARLIAYDSERNQELRSVGQPPVYRLFRPRTLLYVASLAVVGMIMLSVLLLRATVDVNVLPDRNPLFVTLADGSIRNGYTIRVMNKEHVAKSYELRQSQAPPSWRSRASRARAGRIAERPARRGGDYHVFVHLPRSAVAASRTRIELTLKDLDTGAVTTYETIFPGPKR